MDLEERGDYFFDDSVRLNGDLTTTGTITIATDDWIVAYDADTDRVYLKTDE